MPILLNISSPSGKPAAGSSRFWGRPDLPYGSDYPFYTGTDGNEYPYVFICQINLAEIAVYDTGNLLPHEGLLSFFARIDHYLGDFSAPDGIGGYVSGRDAVRVMYIPSCANLEEVPLPDDGRSCPVTPGEMQIVFGAGEPDTSDGHALFASPLHRQWETWDHPFEDWTILLQVDSFEGEDFNLCFMDEGVLDFLISPEDLKRHRFSDVRAIVLSS